MSSTDCVADQLVTLAWIGAWYPAPSTADGDGESVGTTKPRRSA